MGDGTLVGSYAVIVPCDFSELRDTSFDEKALPLSDPQEPISAVVERAGADGLDVTAFPLLCAPLWALCDAYRNSLIRLPLLPA